MGKGDKKTKRGKILMGSHGVRRARRKLEKVIPLVGLKKEKPIAEVEEKASVDEAVKPTRKKAPPKASSKKEEITEEKGQEKSEE